MRTAIFVAPGRPLAIEDRPIPVPGRGQALIRVCRCGICASDIHMTSGSPFDLAPGTAPGHEYAGEVVDAGADGPLKVGDRVTALPMASCGRCPACLADTPLHCPQLLAMAGGYAEYTLIDQRFARRLPTALSFADGALVEPLASALRGIDKLSIESGTRIAVMGVGAIGAGALFWARQAGASRISAIARSRRSEALALAMGADALVLAGDGLPERLAESLGGPPDIIIEAVGAPGMLQRAIECVRPKGTILSLGGCIVPDTILPMLAMFREVRIQFSAAYGARDFDRAIATLDAGRLEPRHMVGETIGLSALPDRFEAMRSGSHPAKIMVDPRLA